jgi:hypothetical protein
MSKYPVEIGPRKKGLLPDFDSPLCIDSDPGDAYVPPNDGVGDSAYAKGTGDRDPLGVVIRDGK